MLPLAEYLLFAIRNVETNVVVTIFTTFCLILLSGQDEKLFRNDIIRLRVNCDDILCRCTPT